MTVVNEIPRVHRWLRTVLAADATLAGLATGGIYRGFAPKRPAAKPSPAEKRSMGFWAALLGAALTLGALVAWLVTR